VGAVVGVNDWVGDFIAVTVGDGVRLCVGVGLNVSEGLSDTLKVEVVVGIGIVTVAEVTLALIPLVFSFIAGVTSGGSAGELQAATIKISMVDRSNFLPVLVWRFAIK
jgi:hypothetical protein